MLFGTRCLTPRTSLNLQHEEQRKRKEDFSQTRKVYREKLPRPEQKHVHVPNEQFPWYKQPDFLPQEEDRK
jgi:hypothetical protein